MILEALDEDLDTQFKTVNYQIENKDEILQFFKVDPVSGVFGLLQSVKGYDLFEFEVIAYDNPTDPSNSNRVNKSIELHITRDYPPEFSNEEPPKYIEEGPSSIGQTIDFEPATDQNADDKICYFVLGLNSLNFTFPDCSQPSLQITSELDREEFVNGLDLEILASNVCDCQSTPDKIDEKSVLNLKIDIQDINDNPPEFAQDTIYSSLLPGDGKDWVKEVIASDKDENPSIQYSTGEIIANGAEIQDIPSPQFEIVSNDNRAQIKPTFTVTGDMKGFFTFDLIANDGENQNSATVKIVIIGEDDRFIITFENDVGSVTQKEAEITQVFDDLFPDWKFNMAQPKDISTRVSTTEVFCHFLNKIDYEPILSITVAA